MGGAGGGDNREGEATTDDEEDGRINIGNERRLIVKLASPLG